MFEFALKAKGAEIYTIDTLKDNFYLIDDINPDLIIFEIDQNKNDLERLYSYSPKTKLVASGPIASQTLLHSSVSSFIPKPIEAHGLAERILALID